MKLDYEQNTSDEAQLHKIDERALRVWRLSGWISAGVYAVIVIVLLVLTWRFDWPIWIVIAAALAAVIGAYFEIGVIPPIRYRQWRYLVTEHEISLRHGIIVRKRTLIPMIRIQHVDSKQGPLMRAFGLASVTFSTAAGSHEIPALTERTAEEVRQRIAHLARLSDEEI
ncbi:PH domain-containing protein [Paenibacillus sp. GCM10027626]|uniref:PH domain-containing protein n=1 Tax=Paenibacillus sp. GCM10027626 TaxID=3273411 RepID=UPI00363AC306